jgi:hypothetical protein
MALDFSPRVSWLGFLLAAIIAFILSSAPNEAVCDFLTPYQETSSTSSVFGVLVHTVYESFCGQELLQDKPDDWNLYYHLGGNGPWIEKTNARFGTYEKDGQPPEGCVIDQVHMVRINKGALDQLKSCCP